MKAFIEEYGKLVILVMIIVALFSVLVLFMRGDITKKFTPKATFEQENVSEQLLDYSNIKEPVLVVETEKLEAGREYDLISFVKEAHANEESVKEDGITKRYVKDTYPLLQLIDNVEIVKITDPFGNEIDVPEKVDGMVLVSFDAYELALEKQNPNEMPDDYTIGYQVTYELADDYYSDYPVKKTATYQFVVD